MIPLTTALSKLLYCEPKNLQEYLNNPEAVVRASEFLKTKKLQTTYLDKNGKTKDVKFGSISLKSASETFAFEGYLGNFFRKNFNTHLFSDVKLIQYYYVKYRIRLLYPKLKCVVEYHNKGHSKYYPIGWSKFIF